MCVCVLFVSCSADDNPTTEPPENVDNDDGGHDSGHHEPDDSYMHFWASGYGGYGGRG